MSKRNHDIPTMVQTYQGRDLKSRGEWLTTLLERFDKDEEGTIEFLRAIAEVWIAEDYLLPDGVDRERPDPGLLQSIGYRVGWHHGRLPETRMWVIHFLLSSPHLPRIKDKEYMGRTSKPETLQEVRPRASQSH